MNHLALASLRGREILRRFDLRPVPADQPAFASAAATAADLADALAPGRMVLVTGPSGAGKTCLLRQLADRIGPRAITSDDLHLSDRPVIDCLHELSIEDALHLLARFGLGEPRTYLLLPHQLSCGERFRLKLAMAFSRASRVGRANAPAVLIADEFATQLDRVTARIIARNLRRAIDGHATLCAVVATCHEDLSGALRPDQSVQCDFGRYTDGKRSAA